MIPAPTMRLRLTLIYGGLFVAGALVVLGLTWLLLRERLNTQTSTFSVSAGEPDPRTGRPVLAYADGRSLDGTNLSAYLAERQEQLRRTALSSLLTQGGLVLAGVGTVAFGLGWLIAGRTLAPLRRVTDTARRIVAAPEVDHGLRERIALAGPADEVKDLADAFDSMLDRLDRSFDSQRRFVANASHELRTPVATSRGVVELAMRRHPGTPELVDLGESLLDISTRQERLIDGLLLLARTENGLAVRQTVDLAAILRKVIAHNTAEATAASVVVDSSAEPAVIVGDPALLERIVQNLIQNAIRHNVPGGWVRAATSQGPDEASLIIVNSGRQLSDEDIPALFEPFRRGANDRLNTVPGVGLGLSIVRSITTAHGGTTVARPNDGGGLSIRITFRTRR